MKKRKHGLVRIIMASVLLVSVLGACNAKPESQQSGIKVEISSEPASIKAQQDVKLVATVMGLKSTNGVDVYFEVKKQGDKKRQIVKVDEGGGAQGIYTAKYAFPDAAKYDIYVHVVTPEAHETSKKTVSVTG